MVSSDTQRGKKSFYARHLQETRKVGTLSLQCEPKKEWALPMVISDEESGSKSPNRAERVLG